VFILSLRCIGDLGKRKVTLQDTKREYWNLQGLYASENDDVIIFSRYYSVSAETVQLKEDQISERQPSVCWAHSASHSLWGGLRARLPGIAAKIETEQRNKLNLLPENRSNNTELDSDFKSARSTIKFRVEAVRFNARLCPFCLSCSIVPEDVA
jgi:hypothetical protein